MSRANLANAILANELTTSATSAVLVTGYGQTMPAVPFKLTITPFGQLSTMGNSEIVLVTARSGDTLTIERAKGGTTAKAFETGDIVSNGIYIENSSAVGDIITSLRATPEPGRLFMNGATHTKANYPLLYDLVQREPAYGTTGGEAGNETFTLKDMRERMPFGMSQNVPWATLGHKAGTQTETLTVAQIPAHGHSPASGGYFITQNNLGGLRGVYVGSTLVTNGNVVAAGVWGNRLEEDSGQLPRPTANTGDGGSHNNMPPVIVVNYEIIAG